MNKTKLFFILLFGFLILGCKLTEQHKINDNKNQISNNKSKANISSKKYKFNIPHWLLGVWVDPNNRNIQYEFTPHNMFMIKGKLYNETVVVVDYLKSFGSQSIIEHVISDNQYKLTIKVANKNLDYNIIKKNLII